MIFAAYGAPNLLRLGVARLTEPVKTGTKIVVELPGSLTPATGFDF